jgi:hypothetical protein
MKVEFLIVCHQNQSTEEVSQILHDTLRETLENNLNEISDEEITESIKLNLIRETENETSGEQTTPRRIIGFDLMLSEDVSYARRVIDEFAASVADAEGIEHVLKFYDDLLLENNLDLARELFEFEMMLRKALSLMYLNAFSSGYYDLLRKDNVKTVGKKPPEDAMKIACENQFFHMSFSKYADLNKRRQVTIQDIADVLQNSQDFDTFKQGILRTPVTNDADKSLIFSLDDLMDEIEVLRNCVAHNRTPETEIVENYLEAKRVLIGDKDGNEELGKIEEFFLPFILGKSD